MAWEKRERGGRYYYRSKREGGQVVKQYVGTGKRAELAAAQDEAEQQQRATRAHAWRQERDRFESSDLAVEELCNATDLVIRAALLSAGYHQHHRGEWRRRRG